MKKSNIKIVAQIVLPIALIILCVFFMSYGNIKNHRSINSFIVDSFLEKDLSKSLSPYFKNYQFNLKKGSLQGRFVVKSGLFNADLADQTLEKYITKQIRIVANSTFVEETRDKTAKDWIIHGGFSADVPEVPASLRHFYDPTQTKGNEYLTDDVNSKILAELQFLLGNPETNGIEWAIGEKGSFGVTEHNYTWENGKVFIKGALEEADVEKRNKFMAKAWRSLGETLHMIADNGCPAHVRNDGHPSIPYFLLSYFGNPDFYEEDMADRDISNFVQSPVSKSLKSILKNETTVESIAQQLAIFTNKNFFTTETISGTDWKGNDISQITHPNYEYKSPKISTNNYSKNYYKTYIDGIDNEVLLATDTWFFMKYPISKTYPYINEECVRSQANVLIPSIIEAGVHVMKLFIPKLKVVISEIKEDGTISGEITHKTDAEYKNEIKYNGKIAIKEFGSIEIATFNVENGKFRGNIKVDKKTLAKAEIEFGGVHVQSDEFYIKPKKEEKEIEGIIEIKNTEKSKGKWVFVNVEIEQKTKELENKNKSYKTVYRFEQKHSKNSSYNKQTYIGKTDTWYNPPRVNGESLGAELKWTDPPEVIIPGDKVSIHFSGNVTDENLSAFGFHFQIGSGACISKKDAKDARWCQGSRNTNGNTTFGCSKKSTSFSETVTISDIGKGEKDEILFIKVSGGIVGAYTKYIYEWK